MDTEPGSRRRRSESDSYTNNNVVKPLQENGTGATIKRSNSMLFVDLTHKHDIPTIFHEAHVESGFRAMDHPWICYVFSIFQLHNETMNVWTHLFALAMVWYKTWQYSFEMDFIGDPHMWPFLCLVISTSLLYLFSTGAHCFHNKSELWHYTCFMLDYTGISIHCFGSTLAHFYYSAENEFFYTAQHWFVKVGAVMSINVCLCCCVAKVIYTNKPGIVSKLFNLCSVALTYTWLILPLLHQIYNCLAHHYKCDESVPLHFAQITWFATGGFFYGSGIPQRFYPGKFDVFGHSHQLFHICVILTTYCQFEAVVIDIRNEHVDLRSRPVPSVLNTFGFGLFVFLCMIVIVKLMRGWVVKKMTEEKSKVN